MNSAEIPIFYRVVWLDPPDIQFHPINVFTSGLGTTEIDLTEDGQTDFRINRSWYSAGDITAEYTTIRAHLISATPLEYGDPIGPDIPWAPIDQSVTIGVRSGLGPYDYGTWAGIIDAYIPIGLLIESELHYGWIRMELLELQIMTDTGEPTEYTWFNFRITEAAWHKIPDTPISAGQLE